jgi:heme-degrading monooxygenase HmoA
LSQREATVIARIWRCWTTPDADAYQRIVTEEVLPGIAARDLDGYHGAYLLRRELDGEVEFATILLFETLDQVRAFAGEDYQAAYVPLRAQAVLTRF